MNLQPLVARDHPLSRWMDCGLRAAGALVLALLGLVATRVGRVPEQQMASPAGFGFATLAVLLIWTGLALLVGGAEWFRPQAMPPRPLFPPSESKQPMTDLLWIGVLAGLTLLTTAFVALCERA
ncbi:hypothetical protein [Novosphingobium sp.]|uniref:hypothetical protein n=1 Tax=Novosphingobium sp. TaxID=1874826 RepID=UPI003BADAB0B